MKRTLFLLTINLFGLIAFSQNTNLFKTEEITGDLYQSNIGKVTFMDGNIPLNQYKKSDFLTSFNLVYKSNLNIRFFLNNSITNYLHELAPNLSAEELVEKGNLQFSFYIDNKPIYKENINSGCNFGYGNSKDTSVIFRIPLTSSKDENLWALHMWDRFKLNGGGEALTNGTHNLRIEIRPYIITNTEALVGNLVAKGQIKLIIKTPKVTAKQIEIQPILPNSEWEISNFQFDRKKIEMLNKEIASYDLKEITSVVAIYDGKLLIEEYFNDASRNTLHDTRSTGKSFASTFIGIAINDGYIKNENQRLSSFYNLGDYANYNAKKDSITIKDLLTMSSSFDGSDAHSESPGNEENMYPTDNWVKFTLNLAIDPSKTNGGKWDYFTAGTILLGDILDRNIPDGLEKYADEKLFKPLNITNYKWQYTPQKVPNTAGSLQMTSLDYAKYAQLYKNNGIWNNKQVIPQAWVEKTLTKQIQIPERDNQFYSYLFWNKTVNYKGKNYETYYCAGNGGNQFIIFKDLPLVIIITSKAFNKPYGHPQADKIVHDYLLPAILK
ncbi:serine hydrolase [Flavobacterium sp. AC]|uniref:Serine hydrolase n=1 Tax=Flavobacterium azizsancarii TaxID=2961580 RepID=A0ABT4W9Y3_9FLAO|nr:serine hydrolase [Flavobacterium azizsancarii]MDA6069343.1 serine hydrolase [Flavobacterium azizsancarii]